MIKQSDLSKIKNLPADTNGALNGKSNNGHTHDDRYYIKGQVDNILDGKANTNHNHNGVYLGVNDTAASSHKLRGWLLSEVSTNFRGIALVGSDGVMEIGKYIDFHIPGNDKDFDVRLEAGSDGKLYCYPGFVGDDFYANKYLRIRDWYGAADDGRIYFKNDGKQMITENVEVFESKKLKAKEGGITSEGLIYAYGTSITADRDLTFGGKIVSTLQSGESNLFCEGRQSANGYGWHFANLQGQYADIYAKVYRQQSDSRTKQEIPKISTLNFLQLGEKEEENFLDKISRVNTKEYFYYNDENKKHILGFFAQDLEKEFPLTVDTMNFSEEQIESGEIIFPKDKEGNDIHDLKTIDSMAVSAVMWNGIQELNEMIKSQKNEIENLKNEIKIIKGQG
jgi:hypothetical protein